MESLAALPTDLAALVDPLARGAASQQRGLALTDAAAGGAEGFAEVLDLLAGPLASGQALPVDGKPLPLALPQVELLAADVDTAESAEGAPLVPVPLEAAATSHGLAVWLALRADSSAATTVGGAPPDPALQPGVTARVPLAPPQAGDPSPRSIALVDGAVAGAVASSEGSVETAPAPPSLESPPPAAAELLDDPSFDPIPLDPRLVANRVRTGAAPAPLSAPLAISAPAASLPTSGEAAALAFARADGVITATRGLRRLDPLVMASAPVPAAEASALASFDWLPPSAPASTSASAPPGAVPAALPQTPVDARAPNWQEAFASRVQVLVDHQVGEARIKLNPAELGAVDVKISFVEDKTYVQLTAATAAARDELAQGLSRLRELFTASGLEFGGASVHGGRGGQSGHSGHGQGYETTPRYAPDLPDLAPPLPGDRLRPGLAAGAIDVFA